jgi:hypothetical protein
MLDKLLASSNDAMRKHYSRWNFMEAKVQAYVNKQDYTKLMDGLNSSNGLPPEPMEIVIPYSYATLHSSATFIGSVLMGQKPMFPLAAARGANAPNAEIMAQVLQHNIDHSGGIETLWQAVWDSLLYSFFCLRCDWKEENGKVMRYVGGKRIFEEGLRYAGNNLANIDPYDCFPDPRVPLSKCSKDGVFIFNRMSVSDIWLKDQESAGNMQWVKQALAENKAKGKADRAPDSNRRIRIGDVGQRAAAKVDDFYSPFEGTVRIIPSEWGLGAETRSELWRFTWFKGGQIISAAPLDMHHEQHPYVFSEPTSLGYEFMSLSQAEMIGVFQDVLSWLVTSRMENVRASIENSFIADPSRIELNDIRSTRIGRIIRLKKSALGLPIDQAIQQLVVNDVTGGHLSDIQTMRVLADTATGVNDNMRGIQTQGGRRSATEARMSMQAGASRVQQLAIRMSAQALHPLASMMISNIQQYIPDELWIEIGGADEKTSLQVTPDMLVGSFNYQISDGSLPLDKTALTEVWKELLFGIARDPELRQQYDLGQIFRYTAVLGGAKNIDSFKKAPLPPQMPNIAAPGVEPGADPNMMPVGAANPFLPQTLGL